MYTREIAEGKHGRAASIEIMSGQRKRKRKRPRELRKTPQLTELSDFLQRLPCQVFATLTTPYSRPQAWWDTFIPEWIKAVQASERKTLGWLRGDERSHQIHSHLILIAGSPLNCRTASQHWLRIANTRDSGQAHIQPFDYCRGAVYYTSKLYGTERDGLSLGGDLEAFLGLVPSRPTIARERRRTRRIQEQMGCGNSPS